jgi:hypothetical protein
MSREGKNLAQLPQTISIREEVLRESRQTNGSDGVYPVSGVTASRRLQGKLDASLQTFTEH